MQSSRLSPSVGSPVCFGVTTLKLALFCLCVTLVSCEANEVRIVSSDDTTTGEKTFLKPGSLKPRRIPALTWNRVSNYC